MKNKILTTLFLSILMSSLFTGYSFAATADDYNNVQYPLTAYKKGINPDISGIHSGNKASVSNVSGNFEMVCNDLYLKGINGLDLSLTRYYSSDESNVVEPKVEGQDGYYLDSCNINTFNDNAYNIGAGWAFDFPYMEVRGSDPYLHFGNSGVWRVGFAGNSVPYLEGYNLNDLKIKYNSSFSTQPFYCSSINVYSDFVVEQKDGKKYYFNCADYKGVLLGIEDQYGNKIKFQYIDANTCYKVYKIIDSVNRELTFNYDEPKNRLVVSITGDGKTRQIIYNKKYLTEKMGFTIFDDTAQCVLDSVVDQESRETKYEYKFYHTKNSLLNSTISENIGIDNFIACLSQVIYPSGAETRINYEIYNKNCGMTGAMQSYRVTDKYDLMKDKLTKKNYESYSYNSFYTESGYSPFITSFDGYPAFNIFNDSQTFPSTFEITSTQTDGINNSVKYAFNKDLLCKQIINEGTDHKNIIDNTYDSNKQLTKKVTTIYGKQAGSLLTNSTIRKVENFSYDGFRNLLGYWDVQTQRDGNDNPLNDEHKTAYSYDTDNYSLLKEKTYKMNSDTEVKLQNTLGGTPCNIQYKKILVKQGAGDYTLKSKTGFIYDSYGNVISERKYNKDTTNLDWNNGCIETCYDYTDNEANRNFSGAYLTRKYNTNVKDSKGNLVTKAGYEAGVVDWKYKYDYFGNTKESTDGNGNVTTYTYDNLDRMKSEIHQADSSSKSWVYVTDTTGNYITLTDENTKQKQYIYNELGYLIQEKELSSNQTLKSYDYDLKMRISTENNHNNSQNSRQITYQYTSDGRIKSNVVKDKDNVLLSSESYLYFDVYDDKGDLCSKIEKTVNGEPNSPSIVTKTYTNKYGFVKKQGKMHKEANDNTYEYIDTFQYDYLGNKIQEKGAIANREGWTAPYTAKYDYDFAGNVTNTYNVKGDYSTVEYDEFGRVKSKTDFKGNKASTKYSTTYTYDNMNRVLSENVPFETAIINNKNVAAESSTKTDYDRNSNVTEKRVIKNKAGEQGSFNKTTFEYNGRNFLMAVSTFNNDTDTTPENITQYSYDLVGNKKFMYTGLKSKLILTDPENPTSTGDSEYSKTKYTYDNLYNLDTVTDPLLKIDDYKYDTNGNLVNEKDRNNNLLTMTYDGLGRIKAKSVTTPDGKGDKSNSFSYYLNGNIKTKDNVTYTYDDLGRLKTETDGKIVKEFDYDAANNRKSLIIKQNGTAKINTTYTYDNMNRLYQVFENSVLAATYAYDENGNRKSLIYSNGNTTDYSYNLANKLNEMTNKKGTTAVSKYTYSYYLNGNQASKTDMAGKATSYVYDGLGRLSSEAPSGQPTISYTYDDYNNRTTMTVAGVSNTAYAYDKNNRLIVETNKAGTTTQTTIYNYDDNGNQISKAAEKLKALANGETESIEVSASDDSTGSKDFTLNEYNGFNQLVKTTSAGTTATYTYNGDGLRTSKTVNGTVTNHVWDGDQIALETDSAGNVTNKYVRGINLLYAENTAGAKQYYLFNGHGDVVQLTGTAGSITKNYDYDAFGNEKNPDANDTNVFRYCGEYFDKETGTVYLRARYYDPQVGRFITEDSYWGKDADPLSLNLYTYCKNSPIIFIDRSGHEYGNVSNFVDDYDGSVKSGKEIVGYNVTYKYQDGSTRTMRCTNLYEKVSGATIESWKFIYRGYVDITIGDNKRRFYYDSNTIDKNGYMKMDRATFLKKMGFCPSTNNYNASVGRIRAAGDWLYSEALSGTAGYAVGESMGPIGWGGVAVGAGVNLVVNRDNLKPGTYYFQKIIVSTGDYTYTTLVTTYVSNDGRSRSTSIVTENDDMWGGIQ